MKRLENTFQQKENILNIYTTAGFPTLNDTITVVTALAKNGADIVEIGIPFSDPLADGETIQKSSQKAIENGITIDHILQQIVEIRKTVDIPILLMGYYNSIMQYGNSFFEKAKEAGVDGLIIPDLPPEIYSEKYQQICEKLALDMVFLITPQTPIERIHYLDQLTTGFLYIVSSYATTGGNSNIHQQQEYFTKLKQQKLTSPQLIGFGIADRKAFDTACKNADGAIIGSAFIKAIAESNNLEETISQFINKYSKKE